MCHETLHGLAYPALQMCSSLTICMPHCDLRQVQLFSFGQITVPTLLSARLVDRSARESSEHHDFLKRCILLHLRMPVTTIDFDLLLPCVHRRISRCWRHQWRPSGRGRRSAALMLVQAAMMCVLPASDTAAGAMSRCAHGRLRVRAEMCACAARPLHTGLQQQPQGSWNGVGVSLGASLPKALRYSCFRLGTSAAATRQ